MSSVIVNVSNATINFGKAQVASYITQGVIKFG